MEAYIVFFELAWIKAYLQRLTALTLARHICPALLKSAQRFLTVNPRAEEMSILPDAILLRRALLIFSSGHVSLGMTSIRSV
mgnify:FL=1